MSLGAKRKKRLLGMIANLAAVFGLTIALSGQALANWPYFLVKGGDVASGGWFDSAAGGQTCASTGYYQTPDWTTNTTFSNTYKQGGILSFMGQNGGAGIGSSSQYAAYSLGEDEFIPASRYGFLTNNNPYPSTSTSNVTDFANFWSLGANPPQPAGFNGTVGPSTFGGGLLEGSNSHNGWHCIPDYYDNFQGTSPAPTDLTGTANQNAINITTVLNGAAGTQYQDNPPAGTGGAAAGVPGLVTLTGGTNLAASWNHTLFIKGNVYINTNITYAAHTAASVQKFALVVLGNIYIGPGATQLDGIYVAQPDMSTTTTIATSGAFWSCQNSTGTLAIPADLATFGTLCKPAPALAVNGSVIASQVLLTRLNAGLAVVGASLSDTGVSETFNYTPEVVIGGSFNPGGSGSQSGQIDSLVSLPPVF